MTRVLRDRAEEQGRSPPPGSCSPAWPTRSTTRSWPSRRTRRTASPIGPASRTRRMLQILRQARRAASCCAACCGCRRVTSGSFTRVHLNDVVRGAMAWCPNGSRSTRSRWAGGWIGAGRGRSDRDQVGAGDRESPANAIDALRAIKPPASSPWILVPGGPSFGRVEDKRARCSRTWCRGCSGPLRRLRRAAGRPGTLHFASNRPEKRAVTWPSSPVRERAARFVVWLPAARRRRLG